jgi:endonuclease-8
VAEGDTLVRIARKLRPALLDRKIVAASAPNPRSSLRIHTRRLEGRRVESIETLGKHLMVHLDDGLVIHSHLGMNGSWRVDDGRGFGKPDRNAWLLLEVAPTPGPDQGQSWGSASRPATGRRIKVGQFGGTTLRLVRSVELARDTRLARLGPDILAPEFDEETAIRAIRNCSGQIGVALLDQTLVCGIGNIFKSEACFEAHIDPWRPASSLDDSEARKLLGIARKQMHSAVETSRRPGRIYKKTGRPCFHCRQARVRSRAQGDDGRTTYWCPACQK